MYQKKKTHMSKCKMGAKNKYMLCRRALIKAQHKDTRTPRYTGSCVMTEAGEIGENYAGENV